MASAGAGDDLMPDDGVADLSAAVERLGADLRALRDLVDERDRRYTEGKEADKRAVDAAFAAAEKAVAAALAAAEKAVNAALVAQEKATEKFERAIKEYKDISNEWISELRIQQQAMESVGKTRIDTTADRGVNVRWAFGVGVAILIAIAGWAVALIR